MMNRISLYIIILISCFITSFAQNNSTIYYMKNVPQANYYNPAFTPKAKFYIGLPAISNFNFNLSHSAFNYNDIITTRETDDSLVLDVDNAISKMRDFNNFISSEIFIDGLSLGFKVKQAYFSFGFTEKVSFRFNYPRDLISLAWKGNAQFLEKPAVFDNIGLDMSYYREYFAATSLKINEKLRVGGRFKLLYGKANINTERSNISIATDPESYAITANADILVNTSGFNFSDTTDFDPMEFVFNKQNKGFAFDFGAEYKLNYKWNVNIAALNLGSISWKSNLKSYRTEENTTFTFEGFDANDFFADNKTTSPIEELTDSLQDAFNIIEEQNTYKTTLTPIFIIGSTYNFTYKTKAGFILQNKIFDKRIYPSLTLSFNKRFGNIFELATTYSIFNNSYLNFGAGIVANLLGLQIYIVTDNILSPILPQSQKNVHLNFGLNLVFGYKDKKVKDKAMID